jgi:hypothetical protein
MYPDRCMQYLNLPHPPQEVLNSINKNFDEYTRKIPGRVHPDSYWWSDNFNFEVNKWCQENISAEMYFAFQAINNSMRPHVDTGTSIKLLYLVDAGGSNVLTEFFDKDNTKIGSYCIEPFRWHLLRVDIPHQVINMEPGKTRFAINGKVFT